MDVKVVEVEVFQGDVVVTFSDGKVSICKAEEVYKFALEPETLQAKQAKESLPEP